MDSSLKPLALLGFSAIAVMAWLAALTATASMRESEPAQGVLALAAGPVSSNGQASSLTDVRYRLGMNVSTVAYWGGDRSFSNLLVGGEWLDPSNGWNGLAADRVDGLGYPLSVPSQGLNKLLTPPAGVLGGAG